MTRTSPQYDLFKRRKPQNPEGSFRIQRELAISHATEIIICLTNIEANGMEASAEEINGIKERFAFTGEIAFKRSMSVITSYWETGGISAELSYQPKLPDGSQRPSFKDTLANLKKLKKTREQVIAQSTGLFAPTTQAKS